jgi:hypothetical protein
LQMEQQLTGHLVQQWPAFQLRSITCNKPIGPFGALIGF